MMGEVLSGHIDQRLDVRITSSSGESTARPVKETAFTPILCLVRC